MNARICREVPVLTLVLGEGDACRIGDVEFNAATDGEGDQGVGMAEVDVGHDGLARQRRDGGDDGFKVLACHTAPDLHTFSALHAGRYLRRVPLT